jgi:REP element-mobilizing transposase RayT
VAREIRIQAPDVIYHVASRGCERRPIFDVVHRDREVFTDMLAAVVREYGWLVHAYCLMGNHFHLVVETPQANISAGMQWLKGQYARWFNGVHPSREGVLFERRFWSCMVLEEAHVYELARYVSLNPVRAGLVRAPEEWPWSSYPGLVGVTARPSFVTPDGILKFFGDGQRGRVRFAQFVGEGIADPRKAALALRAMGASLTPVRS